MFLLYRISSIVCFALQYKLINTIYIFTRLLIAGSDDPNEILISYYGNESHAGIFPLNFCFITTINSSSNAEDIKNTIDEWVTLLPENSTTNWVVTLSKKIYFIPILENKE